ncbi:MAG: hypothetical protein QOD95_2059, partial [Gammaproteobacteria bacterium]|nr:hypothetical protein [Gammaproteobacteria bacterium]
VDGNHERSQPHRHDHQRDQYLDQCKAAGALRMIQLRFSTLLEFSREIFPSASPSTDALA